MTKELHKNEETGGDDFTTRSIMSLVTEAAELQESVQRLCVVLAALASKHDIKF